MTDCIRLNNLEFYGYHGVLPEEKELGQRFVIDLDLGINLEEAGKSDEVEKTVNYAEVYHEVKEVVEGKSYDLIEAVAEKIAERLLTNFTKLNKVIVVVKKPEVPVSGILDEVEVEIERSRK